MGCQALPSSITEPVSSECWQQQGPEEEGQAGKEAWPMGRPMQSSGGPAPGGQDLEFKTSGEESLASVFCTGEPRVPLDS